MSNSTIIIRTFTDPILADIAVSALHNADIPCRIEHKSNVLIVPESLIELHINQEDEGRAIDVLDSMP